MFLDVEYNGILGSNVKVYVKERPSIPAAQRKMKEISIPGRTLYSEVGGYEPTSIQILFNYIEREEKWVERWGVVQKWLSARNTKLIFTDDAEYFYKISHVLLTDNERSSGKIGNFEATFVTVDGLRYLRGGTKEWSKEEVAWNPYEVSHPVYKITGEGKCTVSINRKTMIANVGQNITIDTERMISYRQDGTLQNTSVTGKYKDLYLQEGNNDIQITSGFGLKIIPNWRSL